MVAADTTVVHEGRVMGKPGIPRKLGRCCAYPGDVHEVFTGLAIGSWDGSPEIRSVVDVAEVTMLR